MLELCMNRLSQQKFNSKMEQATVSIGFSPIAPGDSAHASGSSQKLSLFFQVPGFQGCAAMCGISPLVKSPLGSLLTVLSTSLGPHTR